MPGGHGSAWARGTRVCPPARGCWGPGRRPRRPGLAWCMLHKALDRAGAPNPAPPACTPAPQVCGQPLQALGLTGYYLVSAARAWQRSWGPPPPLRRHSLLAPPPPRTRRLPAAPCATAGETVGAAPSPGRRIAAGPAPCPCPAVPLPCAPATACCFPWRAPLPANHRFHLAPYPTFPRCSAIGSAGSTVMPPASSSRAWTAVSASRWDGRLPGECGAARKPARTQQYPVRLAPRVRRTRAPLPSTPFRPPPPPFSLAVRLLPPPPVLCGQPTLLPG